MMSDRTIYGYFVLCFSFIFRLKTLYYSHMPYTQKTLEQYFAEFGISDTQVKTRLLPFVTDLIYDRNMHVVKLDEETDEYKRKQIEDGIGELEAEIKTQFENL